MSAASAAPDHGGAEQASGGATARVGRDGWLFLARDSNDVIGQHTGAVRPGPEWRDGWHAVFADRVALMDRLGVRWAHLISPDKESVYADKLPPEIVLVKRRPVHELLDVAGETGAPLLYPLAELEAAKPRGPVYHQTDSHWSALGCFVAYRLVCERLAREGAAIALVEEDELEWSRVVQAGDLGSKLDPAVAGEGIEARPRRRRSRRVSDNRVRGAGRTIVFEAKRPGTASCVLFGTSYAAAALFLFRESFSRLVYVNTTMVDRLVLDEHRPDVVIVLTSERGLIRVPPDGNAHERLGRAIERKRAAGEVMTRGRGSR